jgi:hypothetical protein
VEILLPQIRSFLSLEGQVPVFISPRSRVAQLYPQALGSLFVASYDPLGNGGGIRTRLHTDSLNHSHFTTANQFVLPRCPLRLTTRDLFSSLYGPGTECTENGLFHYCVFSRCWGNVSTELFPSNGCCTVTCLNSWQVLGSGPNMSH